MWYNGFAAAERRNAFGVIKIEDFSAKPQRVNQKENLMEITRLHSECIKCLLNKFLKNQPTDRDEGYNLFYIQTLLRILSEAKLTDSAPIIMNRIEKALGTRGDFSKEKLYFNELLIKKQDFIREKIASASEPLKLAVKFAQLGNYIDFGALDSVSEEVLESKLNSADKMEIDETEFRNLQTDLERAERLVYLTDNCGEVVLDKLLIEELKAQYPRLQVDVLVRGYPVLNDATMEDAEQIGLTEVANVTSNGSSIAGTVLEDISNKAKAIIDSADVIIAKGQANFETLRYCKKNIYYLFLCKCKTFADRFNVEPGTGMMINDRRMEE